MKVPQRLFAGLITMAAGAVPASQAVAQSYPTKPIRFIVPFAPGGSTDILGRLVAQKLSENLGQQVVVDNRGGAGGSIGTELAARSAPDGYTIVMGHIGTLAMNPTLYPKLPYHPLRDLAPVALLASLPNALVVHPSLPAKSVKELLALARAKPGSVLYGSAGNGSSNHLGTVYLELLAKVKFTHVPYKGAGPAMVDLLAGQVSLMIPGMLAVMPHLKSGKLRLLGVSSAKRLAIMPSVPTIAEAGVPGYEVTNWQGVLAPAGVPAEIVTRLNTAINKVMQHPDVKSRLEAEGAEISGGTPSEFAAKIKSEIARWSPVIRASGARTN